MTLRLFTVCFVLLWPIQASALSCLRPDIERSYGEVAASDDSYVVVQGRLTLNEKKLPKSHSQATPEVVLVKAHLTGKSLGRTGFAVPFERDVTLEVACFGPWCGTAKNGEEILAFVRRDRGRYVVEVSPCGGRVFTNPQPKMLRQVEQCFIAGSCQ